MKASKTGLKASIKNRIKQAKAKKAVWLCSCGYKIPKKGAVLSGDPSYRQGFHVHCPICGKVVAQFLKPNENQ